MTALVSFRVEGVRVQRKNTRRDSLKGMGEFLVVVFCVFPLFVFFFRTSSMLAACQEVGRRWRVGGVIRDVEMRGRNRGRFSTACVCVCRFGACVLFHTLPPTRVASRSLCVEICCALTSHFETQVARAKFWKRRCLLLMTRGVQGWEMR